MLFCFACLVPLLIVPCPLALPVTLASCAIRPCVLRCSPALCALCCMCFVVVCWCMLLFAAVLFAVRVLWCHAVRFCPLRSVRCCAALWCCACVVLFVWCVPLLVPGAVLGCCVLCCFLWWCQVGCCVWLPVVVFWWRVSVSVFLSGRIACFPVVSVVCCPALPPCVVFCGAVLSFGGVLSCCGVILRCCLWLLFFQL